MPLPVDQAAVLNALRVVIDPDLGKDIVSLGFIKRLTIAPDGAVQFAIELTTPACPVKERLQAQAQAAVEAVPGEAAARVPCRPVDPSFQITSCLSSPALYFAAILSSGTGLIFDAMPAQPNCW